MLAVWYFGMCQQTTYPCMDNLLVLPDKFKYNIQAFNNGYIFVIRTIYYNFSIVIKLLNTQHYVSYAKLLPYTGKTTQMN
jgi:hypothetical protein